MASSPGGIVLLSFGSYAKAGLMNQKTKQEIAKAFKHFPQYTFVWDAANPDENLQFYNQFPNLYRSRGLPIERLLFDNRVKAFITNGGQHSYLEASVAGVPQIVISLFADQVNLNVVLTPHLFLVLHGCLRRKKRPRSTHLQIQCHRKINCRRLDRTTL